ncbi:MAG: cobyrinic acid a,c-diamide synthase [Mycobacterium sp.]|nr:cobyrinic acid a,c-diamide synthase [Mycobacterium sp.]
MVRPLPRLVIGAPASGHGKTTVTTGLIAALRQRGVRVSPHKVGPDYIDPGYHALAAGVPGRNLDVHLVGEQRIAPLTAHAAAGADIAIVEGVMGLFDGATGQGERASTAHVAKLLDAPVVLVVDATAQGRSVAAVLQGFRDFDPAVRLAGVILNRVGSDTHEQLLREAVAALGLPVLGALRRSDAVAVPSRHLGLVPVAERSPEATGTVASLAALVAGSVDLNAVLALARTAPPLAARPWSPDAEIAAVGGPVPGRPVVAVAGGPAFTFSYAEQAELLTAAGADVVVVDPLVDPLPADAGALVVGGGFPEVHAAALAANTVLRDQVAAAVAAGMPVAAECAGLLWLARTLDGAPMCGALPADGRMAPKLTLGYRTATAAADNLLHRAGDVVPAHEFHRTVTDPAAGTPAAWRVGERVEGFASASLHASYLHVHPAAVPAASRRLVAAAAAFATRRVPA